MSQKCVEVWLDFSGFEWSPVARCCVYG